MLCCQSAVVTASWYTNPQTEAFCRLIDIPNQINPIPEGFEEAQAAARLVEAEAKEKRAAAMAEQKRQMLEQAKREALEMVQLAGDAVDEEPEGETPDVGVGTGGVVV